MNNNSMMYRLREGRTACLDLSITLKTVCLSLCSDSITMFFYHVRRFSDHCGKDNDGNRGKSLQRAKDDDRHYIRRLTMTEKTIRCWDEIVDMMMLKPIALPRTLHFSINDIESLEYLIKRIPLYTLFSVKIDIERLLKNRIETVNYYF